MKLFSKSVEKCSLLLGIDISNKHQSNSVVKKFLLIYKAFIFILILLILLQNFCNVFIKGLKNFDDFRSLMSAAVGLRALLMNIYLNRHLGRIQMLIKKMELIHRDSQEHKRNQKLFKRGKNIAINVFVANIISTWMYCISGYIEIISCFFTGKSPNPALVFTYELFWPFNPSDYLPWTLFWFSFAAHFWIWSCSLVNLVILYMSVYLTGCFNILQTEIVEIINGCDLRLTSVTKKMFGNFIDRHYEITSCMEDLKILAGFPIIIFIGQASIMICFLGMYALVRI